MRKWAFLLILFAIPLLAQPQDVKQAEIDSLKAELEETKVQLRENQPNPPNLGERLTEAYEAGAAHGERIMNLVTGILTAVSVIVALFAAFGIWQALRLRNMVKVTRIRAESVQKCEAQAKKHLSAIEKIRGEVEQEVKGMRSNLEGLKKDIAKIKKEVKKIEPLKKEVARIDYMSRGYHYLDKKEYNEALVVFEKAIEEDRKNAYAWFQKGYSLSKLGDWVEGLKSFDEAIRLKPDLAEAHSNKGAALIKLSRYEEALESSDEAIRLKPDYAAAHFNKGLALGNLGRYEEALKAYDEAIRLKPDDGAAHINKGFALGKLGRYEEALKSCDEAIRLNPDYAEPYNNRASALGFWGAKLLEASKIDEAIEKFKKAKESAEKAVELFDGKKGYYNLACAQALLGELEEALGSLQKSKNSKELGVIVNFKDAWQDPDFESLRKGKWRKRFEEIVGPPPVMVEEPKAERKAKPKSTKPKKK